MRVEDVFLACMLERGVEMAYILGFQDKPVTFHSRQKHYIVTLGGYKVVPAYKATNPKR